MSLGLISAKGEFGDRCFINQWLSGPGEVFFMRRPQFIENMHIIFCNNLLTSWVQLLSVYTELVSGLVVISYFLVWKWLELVR